MGSNVGHGRTDLRLQPEPLAVGRDGRVELDCVSTLGDMRAVKRMRSALQSIILNDSRPFMIGFLVGRHVHTFRAYAAPTSDPMGSGMLSRAPSRCCPK